MARQLPLLSTGFAAMAVLALLDAGCHCGRSTADGATSSDANASDGGGSSDAMATDTAVDAGPACGDPVAAGNYATCRAATDRPSCETAGGTWTTIGLSPSEECQCPTGQGSCACTSTDDCISACIADTGPGGIFDCAGVTAGMCSPVGITVGCWCWFDDNGTVSALCAD